VAPLAFHARDARYLLNYVLGLWYMITPIIYPINSIPSATLRAFAIYNPLTAPCELIKYGLLDTAPPLANSIVSCLVVLPIILVCGLVFFARAEAREEATV
jgi:lipopolysaccharide transport system permease protein